MKFCKTNLKQFVKKTILFKQNLLNIKLVRNKICFKRFLLIKFKNKLRLNKISFKTNLLKSHKLTMLQGHKVTKLQLQRYRVIEFQGYRVTKLQS